MTTGLIKKLHGLQMAAVTIPLLRINLYEVKVRIEGLKANSQQLSTPLVTST